MSEKMAKRILEHICGIYNEEVIRMDAICIKDLKKI